MSETRSSLRVKLQKGFTLMELFVVVATLGILAVAIAPYFDVMLSVQSRAYQLDQDRINRGISQSMRQWAETRPDLSLPAPYTNAGDQRFSTIMDTGDATLAGLIQFIQDKGINVNEINDDGTNLERVRVYQRLENQVLATPFFGTTGGLVNLTYDVGVIYATRCERLDGTCNLAPLPGDSAAITAGTQATWNTEGEDSTPVRLSTLGLEQERLRITAFRINRIRDQFRAYFNAQLLAAPPGSQANFFPGPASVGVNNQGCWHGWVDLSAGNTLDVVGLGREEYGQTAWGGRIEYCRDYDSAAITQDTVPHVGALRINRNVSAAVAPSGVIGDNLFLTF